VSRHAAVNEATNDLIRAANYFIAFHAVICDAVGELSLTHYAALERAELKFTIAITKTASHYVKRAKEENPSDTVAERHAISSLENHFLAPLTNSIILTRLSTYSRSTSL
jgi:hypothetical protein